MADLKIKKCCPNCFKREGFNFYSEKDMYGGTLEYFICNSCNKKIDVFRVKKFQELLNEESTRYLNQQKEKYAKEQVLKELLLIDCICEYNASCTALLAECKRCKRIKELQVKQ